MCQNETTKRPQKFLILLKKKKKVTFDVFLLLEGGSSISFPLSPTVKHLLLKNIHSENIWG